MRISTRTFGVGVFTQPGPSADMDTVPTHDGFSPVKAIESEGGRGVTAKFATANLYCVEPVATHKSRNRHAMPCQIIDELEILTLTS